MKRGDRKVPNRSYLLRHNQGAAIAFVPDPENAGRWLRVSPCVVFMDCPQCGSKANVPCRSRNGYACSHHCARSDGFSLTRVVQTHRQLIVETGFEPKESDDGRPVE